MRAFFKYGFAIGAAIALAAGCGSTVTVAGDDCVYGGETYSVGDSFDAGDGCNTCTCEEGGAIGCTQVFCEGSCSYNGQTYLVGDSFDAGDGCNTCTCESGGSVSCTNIGCGGCSEPPPECPQPGDPSCESYAECGPDGWQCLLVCEKDCEGDLPPCPPPPEGCFWDGPYCVDGSWTCGSLICEKGCNEEPPFCDEPPGCWAEPVCNGFEWECILHCDEETCESLHPDGADQVYALIFDECSCAPMAPCAQACQAFCSTGMVSNSCNNCIGTQIDNTSGCVIDAAFGDECQSSDACSGYVDCVVEGGP